MASVTDHLIKLQELTQTNLDILQALNDALYTKQNNISLNVGERNYVIPSFISLENKINTLQENFEHLVNAPTTGEAYFNFDGNSRVIEVRGYTHTPNSITLENINKFSVENNNIFKDFLTPNPYINLSLPTLPNDITSVVVKKIIPIHEDLVNLFKSNLSYVVDKQTYDRTSYQYAYKDLYKILSIYTKGTDYIEYDSKIDLPIRENIGNGLYVIEQIVNDEIDKNLDEYITIKFRNDIVDDSYSNNLTYKLFNETIERTLKVGDELVTFDDSAKMEIVEIKNNINEVVVKVLNGEYLNLCPASTNDPKKIHNLSKLKFYSTVDFDKDKYVKVSLEEDKYIFIAVAALNNRMNIQAPWGVGLIVNSHNLLYDANGQDSFETYYNNNVKNVGDILFEITSMMSNTLTKYNKNQYDQFTQAQPIIYTNNLIVTQVNKHLNDSESVKNIRSLYSQKKEYERQLNEINIQITSINEKLAEVSFDDTTNIRSVYTSQLTSLASEQNKLNSAIFKIVNDISLAANNSEVPIENAKYRIRGYFDCQQFLQDNGLENLAKNHIKGLKVQYRYKNINQEQGNALSINGKFIFSDWIDMDSIDLQRISYYLDGYKFKLEDDNSNKNEPSFNQIDIPITQGETVDIRLKVVYDFGWPFVYTTSAWSPIVNIKFPDEYLKDIQILDIIEENNNDIETNRFNNIIKDAGLIDHANNKIMDQDIIYYHKPENISSGFYTSERRIIPLKDKLLTMDNKITELYDDIHGSNNEQLSVSIINGNIINNLQPYIINNISVTSYDSFNSINVDKSEDTDVAEGNYIYNTKTGVVTTLLNINITNNSEHVVKLYSIFPGSRDVELKDIIHTKSGIYKDEYVDMVDNGAVYGLYESTDKDTGETVYNKLPQVANQYITFRIKDVNTGTPFYKNDIEVHKTNYLSINKDYICYDKSLISDEDNCAFMYPMLLNEKFLCINSDTIGSYTTINQGASISIPIVFEYRIKDNVLPSTISKTMSFDVRTSLYNDPITYTFKVTAKAISTTQDKVISANNSLLSKYNTVYK